jgi:hypothetical protein
MPVAGFLGVRPSSEVEVTPKWLRFVVAFVVAFAALTCRPALAAESVPCTPTWTRDTGG